MNNLSSYCGLVDAKIGASDKDLPVQRGQHLCIPLDELKPISHKKRSNVFSFTDGKYLPTK